MENYDDKKNSTKLFGESDDEKDSVVQIAFCPRCRRKVVYRSDCKSIMCYSCETLINKNDLLLSVDEYKNENADDCLMQIVDSIDNPKSARVFLDNYLKDFDWNKYNATINIIVPEIEKLILKNKIKNGSELDTWLLEFKSLVVFIEKRLEGLRSLAQSMGENYTEDDEFLINDDFEHYKEMLEEILEKREKFISRMASDCDFAEQFGAETNCLCQMKDKFAEIKNSLMEIKAVEDTDDIPEVKSKKEVLYTEKLRQIAEKNINAEQVYLKARSLYEADGNREEIMSLFQSINGYKDSAKYIQKLNKLFNFNKKLYHFFDRDFIFRVEEFNSAFNPNSTGADSQESKYKEKEVISLYEIKDGKPESTPLVTDITNIFTVYANKLFYLKLDYSVCYYDFTKKEVFEIEKGNSGDYILNKKYVSRDGHEVYFRKKLAIPEEKVGCFDQIKALFGGKKQVRKRLNNYSIVALNYEDCTLRTMVNEAVDITDYHKDRLFYQKAYEESFVVKDKKDIVPDESENIKIVFNVLNTKTGESKEILDDECIIHNVVDDDVIYTVYSPNSYNKDLHIYNIVEDKDTLIEKNVLDYFRVINKNIYYTIGNEDYCPLIMNNFQGTDRHEIMHNIENIIRVRSGFIYVQKGVGLNSVLIKVSIDGESRHIICTQFSQIVKITDNYIFYIDTLNSLRCVQSNGEKDRIISEDINASDVIVDKDYIYYLRHEYISNDQISNSLYRMDINGQNVVKLVFNVNSIKNFDDETIYIYRNSNVNFEITIPKTSKNSEETKEYITRKIKRFFKYNKNSGELQTILSLGLPEETDYLFKPGCLKKPYTVKTKCKEIAEKETYKRKGLKSAGEVFDEQMKEAEKV